MSRKPTDNVKEHSLGTYNDIGINTVLIGSEQCSLYVYVSFAIITAIIFAQRSAKL